jgi:hypothetical protein
MSVDFSEHLYYDETSLSSLRWKNDIWYGKYRTILKIKADDKAGSIDKDGYWQVKLLGRNYRVHRVVWKIINGDIPEGMTIDHIDGNKANNLISNLRVVSNKINSRNRGVQSNNKTGVVGVTLLEERDCYRAQYVDVDGKVVRKSFKISIYGKEEAFSLACKYRAEALAVLTQLGEGYTNRHMQLNNS